LASNSLLEGLVFGQICGQEVDRQISGEPVEAERQRIVYEIAESERTELDVADVTNSLRSVMWRNVGIVRCRERLEETLEIIDFWRRYVMDKVFDEPSGWQCQNMLTICRLIAKSALARCESRGVHFRRDYPQTDDKQFQHHITLNKTSE